MTKRLFLLFISVITLSNYIYAISIELDGTQTRLSGHQCQEVKYRFGTNSSYQGQDIDLILEVTAEDNEYSNNKCVDIVDNVVGFRLRDKDNNNNIAYMDIKVTVVKKGTLIPINVDTINVTNFDLDNNPYYTDTDDVYYKNPSKVYLSQYTNVTQNSGNFYTQYTTKLKGQDTGNCDDSATLLQKECRAGVSFENSSSFYARVQNDNAYGTSSHDYSYRLIQFSFELKDLTPLMTTIEIPCGEINISTSNDSWIEESQHYEYDNNLDISKTIKITDAQSIKVTINGETENSYDWIYIYDKDGNQIYKKSGNFNNEIVTVPNSEFTIKLTSDYSVTKSGVKVNIEGIGCVEDPEISIDSNPSIIEGDSGIKNLIFNIKLDNPAPQDVTFTYFFIDGNATFGEDYQEGTVSQGHIITIPKDSNSTTISVVINGDTKVENNETFTLKLENITNAIFSPESVSAVGTIINDDTIEPITCLQSAFMFQNRPTDINALNLVNGDMTSIQQDISNDNINAVGFNKKDGYFWGYNYTKQNGTVTRIGMNSQGEWVSEDFLVDGLSGFKSYVGDIDSSGHLYLKERGNKKRVVVIDLDPNSSNYLKKIRDFNLNFNLNTADWGFNPIDNRLYAVNNGSGNKYLYKIDPSNGHKLSQENTLLTGNRGFGASFFDANGFYYVYDNHSGNIYRIDVANSAQAVLFATADIVSLNDGAMCTDAEFKFDFGDLPDNYPTRLESNGARHSLPTYGEPTIYLGSGVSSENNGKPSTDANLDESDDGVKIGNESLQEKTINTGDSVTLKITTHGVGYLNGWIDWNGDGDFNDTNEQIAQNIDGSSGLITLDILVPDTPIDITTYARFRYSYQQDLNPTGSAIDGEVEDYKINIHGDLNILPKLSINDVSQAEGDSGETIFNFTVTANKPFDMMPMSGAMFFYKVIDGDGNEVTPPHGVALSSDHDFKAQQGVGVGINMFGDELSINIPVTVYGDKKEEADEEFFVEIYSPQIPMGMSPRFLIDKNIGVGTILNDDSDVDDDNDGIFNNIEYGSCSTGVEKLMSFDNFGAGDRTSSAYTTYCYEDGDGSVECQINKGIAYWEGNVNVNDGEYAVVQHPNPDASIFSTWTTQGDHTGNQNGRMMVVNASLQPDEFFRKTYTIIPYANMTVDLWILNVVKAGSNIILPNISFKLEDINGNQVGDMVATGDIPENGQWNHYTLSINPQGNSQIQVVLSNNAPGGGGNDLALDDIRVTQTFCDHDSDGVADYLDLDSDNDGIPDNVEAQTTQNYIAPSGVEDENGADSAYNGVSLTLVDSDGDGVADFIDTDSDNDGTPDIDESGLVNHSADVGNNGLYNTLELSDDYSYTQGVAYDKSQSIFKLLDSDNDTLYDGSNASPTSRDFDYRDNNDSKPIFSISDIVKREGDSGVTNFDFKISINRTTGHGITFHYQTFNGDSSNIFENAISGSDYNGINGDINISKDITTKTITVPVIGDRDIEDDEKFFLKAIDINGADRDSFIATGIIVNDDDTDIDNNLSRGDLDEDNDGIWNDTEIGGSLNLISGVDNNFTKVITTTKDKLYRFNFTLNGNSSTSVKGQIKAFTSDNSSIIINNIFYTTDRYDAFFKAKSNHTKIYFQTDTTQDVNISILEVLDSDSDNIPNFLDLDSDNDGIPDNIEAQTTQDYIVPSGVEDSRGVDTAYPNGLTPIDTDGDTKDDYIDRDSDSDGIFDIDESGLDILDSVVGKNGLFGNVEMSDDYNNTQGIAYNKVYNIFILSDSDDDTKQSGENASPTQTDFDYRDTIDNTPRISIDEVISKSEGDSGTKSFRFKIHLTEIPADLDDSSTISYIVRSPSSDELISPAHDIATDGEDFVGKEGNITIQEGIYDYYIGVTVNGDKKIENDEEFLVDITNINFVNRVISSRAIGVILNDDLDIKVERDNSKFTQPKDIRGSFYTQISGRDFDYSIASYKEDDIANPLSDITFKVKLYNSDTNSVERVDYIYFDNNNRSRVVVAKNGDLNIPKAIKDTYFKIYYIKDENGTILRGNYTSNYNETLGSNSNHEFAIEDGSDHFAIRPANFLINIKDLDKNSNAIIYSDNPLNLVAQYPYIIDVNATLYNSNQKTLSYSTDSINSTLIFNSSSSCNDDNNRTLNYSFTNGYFSSTISNSNVGKYLLDINDTNWTVIDQDINATGCILNSSSNTPNSDGKVGCNISPNSKIELEFRPYSFSINTNLKNINSSGKDYLYMSDLTLSRKMGVVVDINITAQGFNGDRLSNFTSSCMAKDSNLSLKYDVLFKNFDGSSDIKTVKGSPVLPQQIVNFNDENSSVTGFNPTILVTSNKFLDDSNGSLNLNILYNIEKKFNEATNPIRVDFISFDMNSTLAEAKIIGENRVPNGVGVVNKSRTFYFARVSPDRLSYPETAKNSIVTPLNLEIFCKLDENRSWCDNNMSMGIIGYNGINTDRGWYLDRLHNDTTEGGVYGLSSNNTKIITQPSTIPPFIHGRIDNLKAIYNSTEPLNDKVSAKIDIDTDVWLRYSTDNINGIPSFKVTFKKVSSLTGTGKAGSIVNSSSTVNRNRNGKMDW